MRPFKRGSSFILALIFLSAGIAQKAIAQPKAGFTASPLSGCSPLVVRFSDTSKGNPVQWRWDLGNGVISTLQHPSATYFNPGTYNIKLVVKSAAGADSVVKQQYVTVYANPVPSFTASDTAGCYPMAVQFNDNSMPGSGTINTWQWDLGDGAISTQQHPSHTYIAAGQYNVTLRLTNSFGCVKSLTKPKYIKPSLGVQADFTYSSADFCTAPVTVNFTNTSTGSGNAYTWLFGDGTQSNDVNPVHTYMANGSYSVTLIAISAQGCRDTMVRKDLLRIGNRQSSFTVRDTVCVKSDVVFKNNSSPQPTSVLWLFGDGTTTTQTAPVKAFAAAGTYTVQLINFFGACSDTVARDIRVVVKPQALFTASDTAFCKTPATVAFGSSSVDVVNYQWFYGDGATGNGSTATHTYNGWGSYPVSLVVINAYGCTDTLKKDALIHIQKPVIHFNGLPATGCTPLTVEPTASVSSLFAVQSWLWKFGDGSTSTAQLPTHTYTNAGNFDVTLIITTVNGCTDSVVMKEAVRTGNKPKANFVVSPGQLCNADAARFTDSSKGNVDQWLWSFGDNLSSGQQNPSHVFDGIGTFTVSLVVWSNTCADTIKKEDVISVLPPLSNFSKQQTCTDKYSVTFKDESVGATSVLWEFGDSTTSTARNPVHTYAKPGNYKVVLKAFNATCINVNSTIVKVVDEKALITIPGNLVCRGNALQFSSPNVADSNIASWQWNFGDGIRSSQRGSTSHNYITNGTYKVVLTLIDVNGCESSDTILVQVAGPKAIPAVSAQAACLANNSLRFFNQSTTDGIHGMAQSLWNFGDGLADTSGMASVLHQYAQTGSYPVTLTVKDSLGCSDVAALPAPVVIAQPTAKFSTGDTLSCVGGSVSFNNQSIAMGPQYQWSFGDGSTSSSLQPVHFYTATGTFDVQLVVTDQYGCTDSTSRSNYVTISLPKASFTVSDSVGNCPPLIVQFQNSSKGYVSLKWDFGDGTNSTLDNPTHFYSMAGTFIARLMVTAPGGCTDTAFQKIVVSGPTGSFTYTPLEGCNPMQVNFSANVHNMASLIWDFSDGNTESATTTTTNHTYTNAGSFVPKMILIDAAGCQVPIPGKDTVQVYGVKAGFSSDVNSLCKWGTVQFANNTVSNDLITSYQWTFSSTQNSSLQNPAFHYDSAGIYRVQLIATTAHGCTDTVVATNAVEVLAAPEISIAGDTAACMPAHIPFAGVVEKGDAQTLSWKWDFANGLTSWGQQPAAQTYLLDGSYTVTAIATAANGCKDTATKAITIHPLPATNAGADVSVCRGSSVQLTATGAQRFVWNQTTSLSCTTCASPMATPVADTQYVVTGFTAFGCSKEDSINVVVHQPFLLQVEKGDTICAGELVHLVAKGADVYNWTPSTSVKDPSKGSTTATPPVTTTYQVIAKDNFNCFTDTRKVFIKVWPIPSVQAGLDQTLVVGQSLKLKASVSSDVSSVFWSPSATLSCATCASTEAKPKQTTKYIVQVKNDGGCTAKDEVTVNVICNNGNVLIPNAFSPNSDGVNDRFYPGGSGISRVKSLQLFNRWGEVVFEKRDFSANDASAGWDGTYKGQSLSADVYIWYCEVICQNGETLAFKGDVTLLK